MVRNQKKMTKESGFKPGKMLAPAVVMLTFWALAFLMWQASGEFMALFFFGYIGASVGIGLGLCAALPKKKKPFYIKNGQRVLSTECSLCQTCITVWAPEALQLSFGLDLGGRELLRLRVGKQRTAGAR
jgi:hypothetical protein